MPFFLLLVMLFVSFIATFILTKFFIKYANKVGLLDIPGERSSHLVNTPRGGGMSIIIVFLIMLFFLWLLSNVIQNDLFFSILIGGGLVACIGFWDDHKDVSAKVRILVHFIAAFISLFVLMELPVISFFYFNFNIVFFVYVVALVWLLNLFNFMDGIDGVASIEMLTVLFCASIIIYANGDIGSPQIFLIYFASVLGFLFWNWPSAKIFMGDACSGFLGFTIGVLAIATSTKEEINLWCWLILLLVFVIDASYTLLHRIFSGEKGYLAHRSHAYQILSRKYNSHKVVTVGVMGVNLIWLFPLAYLASVYEFWAPALTIIASLPILYVVSKAGAGVKNN